MLLHGISNIMVREMIMSKKNILAHRLAWAKKKFIQTGKEYVDN